MCGTAHWEWLEDAYAYHATESFCPGCYQKALKTEESGDSLPGTNVVLMPKGAVPPTTRKPGRRRKRQDTGSRLS